MPELRRLAWPTSARVDLARDFRWLVHPEGSDDARGASEQLASSSEAARASDWNASGHSPYARALRKPPALRAPLSPAQRAAKKILKLRLELVGADGGNADPSQQPWLRGEPDGAHEADAASEAHRTTSATVRNTAAKSAPSKQQAKEKVRVLPKSVVDFQSTVALSRTATAGRTLGSGALKLAPSSPASRAKKQPESKEKRELRELREKQQRLAEWISADDKRSTRKRKNSDNHTLDATYSVEVETRILNAMEATRDRGLWGDQVASLIAKEMTSEAVFGGLIGTRRLAFPASASASTSPARSPDLRLGREMAHGASPTKRSLDTDDPNDTESRCADSLIPQEVRSCAAPVLEEGNPSLIHERAMEIREEAQSLVRAGNIDDALATLQDGIKQLLFDFHDNQDEIEQHGFNYSQDAHDKAIRVQLKYRARHRDRVRKCVVLQRMWRRYQARKAFVDAKRYKAANASVIQRYYKARFRRTRRRNAATRIQTCFRLFREQKLLIYWRRACRLLLEDARRRRERFQRIWAKVGADLAMRSLWKSRYHAVACIQSHWRGSRVRKVYAALLEESVAIELVRRSHEDHFFQARIDKTMASYHRFLTTTRIGAGVVRWQMNKPWIRYRRLRAEDWNEADLEAKVRALYAIQLYQHNSSPVSARLLRVLGHVLGIDRDQVQRIQLSLQDATLDAILAVFQDCSSPDKFTDDATVVLPATSKGSRVSMWFRKRAKRLRIWWANALLGLNRALLLIYWHAVVFPFSFWCVRAASSNRQRALMLLEAQQRFALVKFLRHAYRLASCSGGETRHGLPGLICKFCAEAFVTATTYNTHMRACKQRHHDQCVEWTEVGRDLAFLEQKEWCQRRRTPLSSDPQTYLDFADLELDTLVAETTNAQHRHHQQKSWWSCLLGQSWWQHFHRKRALCSLVSVALCCDSGCPANDREGGEPYDVALGLVAYLLLAVRTETLHSLALPQLHAFVDWQQVSAKRVSEQELLACFLGTPSFSRGCLGEWKSTSVVTLLQRFTENTAHRVGGWWRHATTWWWRRSPGTSTKYHHHYHQQQQRSSSAPSPSATVLPVS